MSQRYQNQPQGRLQANAFGRGGWKSKRTKCDKVALSSIRGGFLGGKSERDDEAGGNGHAESDAVASDSTSNDDEDEKDRLRGMGVALAATYFTVMGAKCALPSVLTMLMSPSTGLTFGSEWDMAPQQLVSRLLLMATMAVALGKLLLGPVIDYCGGILSLQASLSLLTILLAIITFGQSFSTFAVCWIFVDFIFSSCWAGCINAIHQSFPRREWANQIGTLAAAARTGNAIAFALFASVLEYFQFRMQQPWRAVFAISAASQVLPIALLAIFGKARSERKTETTSSSADGNVVNEEALESEQRKPENRSPSFRVSLGVLRREACRAVFWMHLLSRSALMVFASFLLFVPTLMTEVYGTSPAFAAQTGSIFALGCLLSVTAGSQFYSRLPKVGKICSLLTLLGTATLSSFAQLAHVSGAWNISANVAAVLLFLWGFSFAIPFYIPPSLYALSRGGTHSSATIADVFDIAGFGLLAVFNGYVAGIAHAVPMAWIPTFQVTTGCTVLSLITLSLTVLLE